MLADKKRAVTRFAANRRLGRQMAEEYGLFLRTLFSVGDWIVTLTFRDRYQDTQDKSRNSSQARGERYKVDGNPQSSAKCSPDPRLENWEPDSRYRREPGPPVKDLALREIEHWLLELGWEAAGHSRQEIFDRLADGLLRNERRDFAKRISRKCLCCAVLADPVTFSFFYDIHKIATATIGWVIAEEFGRAGGRWHVHLLVRGAQHVRRKKWWKRAFLRFGRSRIEAIHE
jgi:hypothetical protein